MPSHENHLNTHKNTKIEVEQVEILNKHCADVVLILQDIYSLGKL